MTVADQTRRRADAAPTEQRLLLHNVRWNDYLTIGEALQDRAGLRLTYDRGTLEIMTTSSPPAPDVWTSDAQRMIFHFVDWSDYEKLLKALDGHHLRTTYDRGDFEIMSPSSQHERFKFLLGRFIGVLGAELRTPLYGLASTTFQRSDLVRGLEPDECYYTVNRAAVKGKPRIDLAVDPPPDLAVEVDITSSSLDRMNVYAAIGVPELWRFDGEVMCMYRRRDDGQYEECGRSLTFPAVVPADFARLLRESADLDDEEAIDAFRAWVRTLANR